ncbi:MAG: permease, partial [Eubacterium sp.]|nr:permease [Eubacterium sp.]
ISCTVCGIVAGLVVHIFYQEKSFFNFEGFEPRASHDTHPNLLLRFLFNLGRNIKATALWFLVGVLLSALFQRYVPADDFAELFGKSNEGFGVLMAATIGVPLYACGGGTIPLIREWLAMGMSMGSASAFMITGPATKITNLGALKIVLGVKRFILYIAFVMAFSLVTGLIVNLIV